MSDELEKTTEQELEELEAEILGNSEEETEEEKAARIATEQKQSEETDEEREAREKVEADAAAEEARVAALSEEDRVAEEKAQQEAAAEEAERLKAEEDEGKERNKVNAHARHQIKELKAKVAAFEKKPDPQGESVENTVGKLVKVWDSGEGDEGGLLAGVRKAGTQEVMAIHQKAVAGEYGDHSEDVITMIARELPMIQAREAATNKEAKTQQDALVQSYKVEVDQAEADFPSYADAESPAAKAKVEFDKTYLGTLDPKTGELDGEGELPDDLALYLHSHPYVAHQFADAVFKAQTLNSDTSKADVAKLTTERDTLKERLSKYEAVESPSSATKTTQAKGNDSLEDLEKQILDSIKRS